MGLGIEFLYGVSVRGNYQPSLGMRHLRRFLRSRRADLREETQDNGDVKPEASIHPEFYPTPEEAAGVIQFLLADIKIQKMVPSEMGGMIHFTHLSKSWWSAPQP
jgi:hypothetical protein